MRRMTGSEKLRQMSDMGKTLFAIVEAEVRKAHPEADEHEVRMRVASRYLPPELLLKAFGWDVKEKGY